MEVPLNRVCLPSHLVTSRCHLRLWSHLMIRLGRSQFLDHSCGHWQDKGPRMLWVKASASH